MKIPQRHEGSESRVEMIPLIDVVFLVLVAFIYASMFMTQKTGLPVALPEASEAETTASEILTLTITAEAVVYLNDQIMPIAQLGEALMEVKRTSPDIQLFVIADRAAPLDPLVKVMDRARQAGIANLTIATERPGTVQVQ